MAVNMGSAKGTLGLDATGFFSSIQSAITELHNLSSAAGTASGGIDNLESSLSGAGGGLSGTLSDVTGAASGAASGVEEVGEASEDASTHTGTFGSKLKSAWEHMKNAIPDAKTLSDRLKTFGKEAETAGKNLTKYITTPLLGIGTYSLKTSMDFEATMSKVGAISGATGEELEQLSNKAKELGATTKFTNTEVAEAFIYMAMAGWKTEDMLEGVDGILNLSAASGADLARASDIVTDALTAMGYSAEDAGRLADVMATASSNSNTNVELMGETFKYVAPLVGSMGYSMEDTAVAIGLMANAGIKGSQAGTSLRSVITRLASPTKETMKAMSDLGIELENTGEDGTKSLKSLSELMIDLRSAFGKAKIPEDELNESLQSISNTRERLDEQLEDGTITQKEYGNMMEDLADTEYHLMERAYGAEGALKAQYASQIAGKNALSGFLAIVNSSDEDFYNLVAAVEASDGAAQNMADTMLNNAAGSFTIFKSQMEAVATEIGDILAPKFTDLLSKISDVVTKFSELDESTQNTIINFGLFAAAAGPVLKIIGGLSKGLGSVISFGSKFATVFGPSIASGIAKLGTLVSSGVGALLAPATLGLGTVLAGLAAFLAGYGIGTLIYDAIGPQIDEVLWPVFDKIVAAWDTVVSFFTESIPQAFSTFAGYFSTGVDEITSFFSGIITSISEFFLGIWDTISTTFTGIASWVDENIVQPILSVVEPIVTKIAEIIAKIWEIIVTLFSVAATWVDTNILQPIITGVSSFVSMIIGWFQKLWDGIVSIFKTSAAWWNENVITPIDEAVETLVGAIIDFFTWAWDGITGVFSAIGEWFGERWDEVTEVFSGVAEWFEGVFQDAVDAIEEVFGGISDWFSDLWDDITETFDYAATAIGEAFESAFKSVFNAVMTKVESAINFFVDAVNGAVDLINEIPGVDIGKLERLSLPRLSVGLDYVPYDDYQALLHKGERVLTKEENEAYTQGMGQGGNTFNFYSPESIDEVTAAQEFKRVQQELVEGL